MAPNGQRLRLEVAQLAAAYPGLRIAQDDSWVLIPEFRLPAGWEPVLTTVLVIVPATYPECAPDGFFLGSLLRRHDGTVLSRPGHYFYDYKNPYSGLGYVWYCLEDPDRQWDPLADSLLTFVEAIRTYLGTAD
ncbi:E2/UBC family protein [Frankia tisae]|uniref:E2/UBC family protein n=1 Tax=Frankia tisae TaxID=2950104 RepID=UPI0021BF4A89|nr:E2/UBC family protein [Frankia tisae]